MTALRTPLLAVSIALGLLGCQSDRGKPLETVAQLDLERFMGDWYVVANIPTFLERGAHNAVESYRLVGERQVETTFSFRDGGFDGPLQTYRPTGFVSDTNNAVWGMQFVWPFKAEYLVLYVDADYRHTVIGRSRRDYIWLMAREPVVGDQDMRAMLEAAESAGYDLGLIEKVPQQWPGRG